MRIKPKTPRTIVRDPITKLPLPAKGRNVPNNSYWRRRIKAGDVLLIPDIEPAPLPPPPPPPPPPAPEFTGDEAPLEEDEVRIDEGPSTLDLEEEESKPKRKNKKRKRK